MTITGTQIAFTDQVISNEINLLRFASFSHTDVNTTDLTQMVTEQTCSTPAMGVLCWCLVPLH